MLIFILLLLLLLFIKNIIDINQFKSDSNIIYLDELSNYKNKRIFNPLIIRYNNSKFNIHKFIDNHLLNYYINPDDTMIRLNDFLLDKSHYIYKSDKLFNDMDIFDDISNITDNFINYLCCNIKYTSFKSNSTNS